MSSNERDKPKDSLGYQTKSEEEVDEIVKRLSTPKKQKEKKTPDRCRKIERQMTAADIDEMVKRLTSARRRSERPPSAYEQGGIFLSYSVTGWARPGSGGKHMA